jgi:hypothetical protein
MQKLRLRNAGTVLLGCLSLYYLSSGPILATAFLLREVTGRDEFHGAMWIFAPLFLLPRPIWDPYIEWWVELFRTVGPG